MTIANDKPNPKPDKPFARSLEKIAWGLPPERFTEDDWHGLLDGYQQLPVPQAS